MSELASPKITRRPARRTDWTKILDTLMEHAIISGNFTGELVLTFNCGGVTGCKRVETLK